MMLVTINHYMGDKTLAVLLVLFVLLVTSDTSACRFLLVVGCDYSLSFLCLPFYCSAHEMGVLSGQFSGRCL